MVWGPSSCSCCCLTESCLLLTQEAFCAVSILLWEAAGGMEDVGEGNH